LFKNNLSWQANSQFHIVLWDCENVKRVHPEFWRQKNWLLHQDSALSSFFSSEFLTQNTMTVILHPPYMPDLGHSDFSVSPIEDTAILIQL
jgi:hypothetical protein